MSTRSRGEASALSPSTSGYQPSSKAQVADPHRKKILLAGHKGAGKTACKEVAFHGMGAKETFSLEPTRKVSKENLDILIPIQVWDCPGDYAIENLPVLLSAFSTVVYVIDIQDDYAVPIHMFTQLLAQIYVETQNSPKPMNIEVFVHKADGISEDYRLEYFRHLQERIEESCISHDSPLENLQLTYHLTSCYDYTIHESWSRVIQKLIDSLSTLENLVTVLLSNSGLTKVYLFDVKTLIHVGADESPPDATMYGLCCEYIQTIMQLSKLYSAVEWEPPDNVAPFRREQHDAYLALVTSPPIASESYTQSSLSASSKPSLRLPPLAIGAPSSSGRNLATPSQNGSNNRPPPSPVSPASPSTLKPRSKAKNNSYSKGKAPSSKLLPAPGEVSSSPSSDSHPGSPQPIAQIQSPSSSRVTSSTTVPTTGKGKQRPNRTATASSVISDEASAVFSLDSSDDKGRVWATSCVRLKPQTVLAYWEITDELSIVALIRAETWEANQSLIDYNITYVRKAIRRVVDLEDSKWKGIEEANPPGADTVYSPPSRSRPSYAV